MAKARNRQQSRFTSEHAGLFILLAILAWFFLVLVPAIAIASAWAGMNTDVPAGPMQVFQAALHPTERWPVFANALIGVFTLLLVAVPVAALVWWRRRSRGKLRGDDAQPLLGRGKDLAGISEKSARAKAARFGLANVTAPTAEWKDIK